MSARINPDLPTGAAQSRQVKFTTPGSTTALVIGTDQKTLETTFDLAAPNSILQAKIDVSQTTTNVSYTFFLKRDGDTIYTLYDDELKRDAQFISPKFPLNLSAGRYQWVMQQTAGTLAGRTLNIIWQTRLV